MPVFLVPLVPAAMSAAGAVAGGVAVYVAQLQARRMANRYVRENAEKFMAEACAGFNIDIAEGGGLTDESLTAAVNKLIAGSGVELSSVLDGEKMRSSLERAAVQRLAEQVGVQLDNPTMSGIREALHDWAIEQVGEQLTQEAGAIWDDARESGLILQVIEKMKNQGQPKADLDMSKEAISNRERQAKYRASHTREWVAR